ncbi:MAG TPA: hypothetical protein VFR78_23205 [Pyrinomonadaceae bacterium]|nr:hypothetical protein [Pyrinomonadaceae bacterium]
MGRGCGLCESVSRRSCWWSKLFRALKAPLPQIELVPTGGVSLTTAADFVKAGAAALGVGGDLCDLKAICEGNVSVITERAKQFLEIVRQARDR